MKKQLKRQEGIEKKGDNKETQAVNAKQDLEDARPRDDKKEGNSATQKELEQRILTKEQVIKDLTAQCNKTKLEVEAWWKQKTLEHEKKVKELEEQRKGHETRAAKFAKEKDAFDLRMAELITRESAAELHAQEPRHRELQEKVVKLEQELNTLRQRKPDPPLADLWCPACGQFVDRVGKRMEQIDKDYADVLKKQANSSGEEFSNLKEMQQTLETAKKALENRIEELNRREAEQVKKAVEFEKQCSDWREVVKSNAESVSTRMANELISNTQAAWTQVHKYKTELAEKLEQTREITDNLEQSEKTLKDRVSRVQQYIAWIDKHGVLPETVALKRLLRAVKHIGQPQVKCFISFADQNKTNTVLQGKLLKLREDLMKAGVVVMFDWSGTSGDIAHYMKNGITTSFQVLLICTSDNENNLEKKLSNALERQKVDPKFIIPLILEGDEDDFNGANLVKNILTLDFDEPSKYCNRIVDLNPKGLLPQLLGLEKNFCYTQLLKGYRLQVKDMQNKQKLVIG